MYICSQEKGNMRGKITTLLTISLIAIGIGFSAGSCKVLKKDPQKKQEKRLAKTEKKRKKAEAKQYRDAIKQHMKNQSKGTRKMMRKHRRKSNKTIDLNTE
ncbi:MAG: hypothetical protein KKA07_13150 [Bacteroidetes bacterium]|nr:hypothetical protein [Bacteroidota bacterium]MBU1720006.1 hypothetical protein [Bacteroidota bacterium]